MITSKQDFIEHIIAQDDDEDYSESGWVAVIKDSWAALARYSHCSCNGTWTALDEAGKVAWRWEGTIPELISLAKNHRDPEMPSRKADENDYDYDHLLKVYQEILALEENAEKYLTHEKASLRNLAKGLIEAKEFCKIK